MSRLVVLIRRFKYIPEGLYLILVIPLFLLLIYLNYISDKPVYSYTLTCADRVIVKDVRHLYLQHRSGTYSFNSGSYTPKQGEVCIVTQVEIK